MTHERIRTAACASGSRRSRCPGPLHDSAKAACGAALLPATQDAALTFALARALQTSVWKPLAGLAPTADSFDATAACGLCETSPSEAAAREGESRGARPAAGRQRRTGPRHRFDQHAEHVSACPRVGPAANSLTRHNRLVRVCVELGNRCGISSRFHDGPLINQGDTRRGSRPADWLERGSSRPLINLGTSLEDATTSFSSQEMRSQRSCGST